MSKLTESNDCDLNDNIKSVYALQTFKLNDTDTNKNQNEYVDTINKDRGVYMSKSMPATSTEIIDIAGIKDVFTIQNTIGTPDYDNKFEDNELNIDDDLSFVWEPTDDFTSKKLSAPTCVTDSVSTKMVMISKGKLDTQLQAPGFSSKIKTNSTKSVYINNVPVGILENEKVKFAVGV